MKKPTKYKILNRILCCLLSAVMCLSLPGGFSYAENSDNAVDNEIVDKPETVSKITLRNDLKAAVVNFSDIGEKNYAATLEEIYNKLIAYGLNSVYINPYGKNSYFTTDMNEASDDMLSTALDLASKKGISAFVYLDINKLSEKCEKTADKTDFLISEVHRFVIKYHCKGIILKNFYLDNNNAYYEEYMNTGSGIGYKNWLYSTVKQRVKLISEVIHLTDNTVAVGIAADVWANSSAKSDGSETSADFEAFYDGYADTKAFVENGYFDFIAIDANGSIDSEILPFENYCKWWSDCAKVSDTAVYVVHHNENLGTDGDWAVEDQLLKQLAICDDFDNCYGSVMYSVSALEENPMGTTDTLIKYFNDQINPEALFEDLEMTSPYYTNYSTTENSVAFMGTFDENFDVYFDGEKLTLNEAGNFYFEEPLDIGMNTFTIKHKGKLITYNIERTINVLKSVGTSIYEGKTIRVDGGNTVSILCTAYKGSYVTATVNGTTIKLKENARSEDADLNSSYASFTGKYTVPEGIIGEEQYLGKIELYAEYSGYSRTYIGAQVIVNEIEPPVDDAVIEEEIPEDQSSFGTGEVIGKISPSIDDDTEVYFVRLLKDYVYIYDGSNTDSVNPPNIGQLPKGTLDYYSSEWDEYYVTSSGKRFLIEDSEVISGYGLGENPLVVDSIGNSKGDSFIKMKLEDRVTFTVTPIGNEYYSGYDGDFYLDSFTAEYVYITFDNVTSVTALPSFENCSVFSDGKWEQVTINDVPKFRLVLKLRQPGVYAGNSATYDGDGNLVFKFEILTNDISNMTIVIDPGHGKTEYDYDDPGAIGHIEEAGANLAVAKYLEQILTDMGANVVRLKTESEFIDTKQRPYVARTYGCDLYIAIHSNKASYEEPRGTECYYYTSYSQPLAKALSSNVSSYFSNYVYSDGADCNRGDLYSYMWTTKQQDFPSVLIEMGFVSNYEDAMALASSEHQQGIAQAIADGIVEYISRSSISSY